MPKVLKVEDADAQVDADIEREVNTKFTATPGMQIGDLTDGGTVNGAMVYPTQDGRKLGEGRPNARRAWMWNGSETMLPLAWDTSGKVHDSAARYLRKRYCLCCKQGGFQAKQCPGCVKSGCASCGRSTDASKIIPVFYLDPKRVPFPAKFYGDIPCFMEFCIRRGDRGFKTEQDMRIHARTKHRLEYQAHVEVQNASKSDEVTELRARLDALISAQIRTVVQDAPAEKSTGWTPEKRAAARERMKARAAKKQVATPVAAT